MRLTGFILLFRKNLFKTLTIASKIAFFFFLLSNARMSKNRTRKNTKNSKIAVPLPNKRIKKIIKFTIFGKKIKTFYKIAKFEYCANQFEYCAKITNFINQFLPKIAKFANQ